MTGISRSSRGNADEFRTLGNAVRIVIAPDKFEGSLSAGEAARCLSTGIREARADAEVAVVPMADGGEGTLDAARVNGYERREAVVHGRLGAPCGRPSQ
jgi:glycerate 2-kinase